MITILTAPGGFNDDLEANITRGSEVCETSVVKIMRARTAIKQLLRDSSSVNAVMGPIFFVLNHNKNENIAQFICWAQGKSNGWFSKVLGWMQKFCYSRCEISWYTLPATLQIFNLFHFIHRIPWSCHNTERVRENFYSGTGSFAAKLYW